MPVGGGRQHKNEEGGGRSYPCVPLLFGEPQLADARHPPLVDGHMEPGPLLGLLVCWLVREGAKSIGPQP